MAAFSATMAAEECVVVGNLDGLTPESVFSTSGQPSGRQRPDHVCDQLVIERSRDGVATSGGSAWLVHGNRPAIRLEVKRRASPRQERPQRGVLSLLTGLYWPLVHDPLQSPQRPQRCVALSPRWSGWSPAPASRSAFIWSYCDRSSAVRSRFSAAALSSRDLAWSQVFWRCSRRLEKGVICHDEPLSEVQKVSLMSDGGLHPCRQSCFLQIQCAAAHR